MKRWMCWGLGLVLLMSILPGVRAAEAPASDEIAHRGYIVKLRDDVALPLSLPEESRALGGGMYCVQSPADGFELAGEGAVEFIEPNYIRTLYDGDLVDDFYYHEGFQWNLDAMDIGPLWALTDGEGQALTGTGVTVAVVDTGLTPHEDLEPARMLQGHNSVDGGDDATDVHSHGTFVAGLIAATANNAQGIAGVAYGASILPCAVCQIADDKVAADDAHIVDAIVWATDQGAQVINVSMGGAQPNEAIRQAVDYAVDRGVIVIAAVGNDKTAALTYPAAYPNVVGVGALGSVVDISAKRYKLSDKGAWAQYSNFNQSVFVTAPGTQVPSTAVSAAGLSEYDYRSGTSYAAPCVAAMAALCKQYDPAMTSSQFQNLLMLTAQDRGEAGWDPYYGFGAVNGAAMAAALPQRHIQYHLNGGHWTEPPAETFQVYADAPLSLPTPIREGYTFAGWYEDPDCAGAPQTQIVLPALEEDRSFYALWYSDNVALDAPPVLTLGEQSYPFTPEGEGYVLSLPFGTDLTGGQITVTAADPDAVARLLPEDEAPGHWTVQVTAQSGLRRDYPLLVDRSIHAPTLAPDVSDTLAATAHPASWDGLTAAEDWQLDLREVFACGGDQPPEYLLSQLRVDGEDIPPAQLPNLVLAQGLLRFVPAAEQAKKVISFRLAAVNALFASPEVAVTLTVGPVPSDRPQPTPPLPPSTPTPTPTPEVSPSAVPSPAQTAKPHHRPHRSQPQPTPTAQPSAAPTAAGDALSDIGGHWAHDAMVFSANRQLLSPIAPNRLGPDDEADWACALAALAQFSGQPSLPSPLTRPEADGPLTRESLVVLLWRFSGQPEAGDLTGFSDLDQLSSQGAPAMAWAVERGIVTGCPGGLLAPQARPSRAELATMLYRLAAKL